MNVDNPTGIQKNNAVHDTGTDTLDSHGRYRWKDELTEMSRNTINENIDVLYKCLQNNDLNTESGIENCVSGFIDNLKILLKDLFSVDTKQRINSSSHVVTPNPNFITNKPG